MPVESFVHQARERCWHYCRITSGNLVLNDYMRHAMHPWVLANGQMVAAVVRDGQVDALLLIDL